MKLLRYSDFAVPNAQGEIRSVRVRREMNRPGSALTTFGSVTNRPGFASATAEDELIADDFEKAAEAPKPFDGWVKEWHHPASSSVASTGDLQDPISAVTQPARGQIDHYMYTSVCPSLLVGTFQPGAPSPWPLSGRTCVCLCYIRS